MKAMPSQDELRRMFDYDEGTGDLIWKYRPEYRSDWNAKMAGQRAGSPTNTGHFQITISGQKYLLHRIIWKWLHGIDPPVIDHRDGNGHNNTPTNLRATTQADNACNGRRRKGKALPKGVFIGRHGRIFAQIRKGGRSFHLGCFDTVTEAHAAYRAAATEMHGEFARFD